MGGLCCILLACRLRMQHQLNRFYRKVSEVVLSLIHISPDSDRQEPPRRPPPPLPVEEDCRRLSVAFLPGKIFLSSQIVLSKGIGEKLFERQLLDRFPIGEENFKIRAAEFRHHLAEMCIRDRNRSLLQNLTFCNRPCWVVSLFSCAARHFIFS